MAQATVRIFGTEQAASNALKELKRQGFQDARQINPPPPPSGESGETDHEAPDPAAIKAAISQADISEEQAAIYAKAIEHGHSLVTVKPPFGRAKLAEKILERFGPMPSEAETTHIDATSPNTDTVSTEAAPFSSWLGWKLLLHDPAPFSRLLGWRVLSNDASPLSRRMGWKELSHSPTPLSDKLNWPVLSNRAAPLSEWLGWRTISSNPTPLSSWLGWPVLYRRK